MCKLLIDLSTCEHAIFNVFCLTDSSRKLYDTFIGEICHPSLLGIAISHVSPSNFQMDALPCGYVIYERLFWTALCLTLVNMSDPIYVGQLAGIKSYMCASIPDLVIMLYFSIDGNFMVCYHQDDFSDFC